MVERRRSGGGAKAERRRSADAAKAEAERRRSGGLEGEGSSGGLQGVKDAPGRTIVARLREQSWCPRRRKLLELPLCRPLLPPPEGSGFFSRVEV